MICLDGYAFFVCKVKTGRRFADYLIQWPGATSATVFLLLHGWCIIELLISYDAERFRDSGKSLFKFGNELSRWLSCNHHSERSDIQSAMGNSQKNHGIN